MQTCPHTAGSLWVLQHLLSACESQRGPGRMVNYSHPIKNISPDAVDNCGNPLLEVRTYQVCISDTYFTIPQRVEG